MKVITYEFALAIARNLRSEDGENTEYDRALLEFLYDAFGPTREEVAADLGVTLGRLYK